MASQQSLDQCYMEVAESHAKLSKAERKKVGCALVTANGAILGGCNGLAPNSSNTLEYKDGNVLFTKPEVIHAELNCILKAAREGVSVVGATLYTTLSCCKPCSEMVAASGVKRVVYKEEYRDTSSLDFLMKANIKIEKYNQ